MLLPAWTLPMLGLAVGTTIPLYAWRARGRTYATFATVLLLISVPAALVLELRLRALLPVSAGAGLNLATVWMLLATGVHLASLVRARMRPRWFRLGVSLPGMAFLALGALAGPWLVAWLPIRGGLLALGHADLAGSLAWVDWAPVAVVGISLVTSLGIRREVVRLELDPSRPDQVSRLPVERHRRDAPRAARLPLRLAQLTDTHLGPWQSVRRLRSRVQEVVDQEPDLILLTGDFLTMESNATPGALAEALSPLQEAPGRCYAIFGNHDHEAPAEVRAGLAANGVRLLVDESELVETPLGDVQIVGADWRRTERRERLHELLAANPRRGSALRLLLLHDPSAFADVPPGEVDLTLSGHTHGGQVGLVSFGSSWTVLSRTRWPDHGLFGHGASRLYVHRGTGFYGFPLRIGVPAELSILELVPAAAGPGGVDWRASETPAPA